MVTAEEREEMYEREETTELILTKSEFRIIRGALNTHGDTLAECLKDEELTPEERLGFQEDSDKTEHLIEFLKDVASDLEWP